MGRTWLIINLVLINFIVLLTTVIFCSWFVYLLRTIQKQWKSYGSLIHTSSHQNHSMEVYNAKTEFTKNIFLSFMNLVEWLAFVTNCGSYLIKVFYSDSYCQYNNTSNQSVYRDEDKTIPCFLKSTQMHYTSGLMNSILFLGDNLIVLSLILISCLCEYLVERYSHKSWLKSNKIPVIIAIFLTYLTVIQFISLFCFTLIIARWFNTILLTVSLVIVVRQYKKLEMVVQWTITDLEISQVSRRVLKAVIRQKKALSAVSKFIWVGTVIMIADEYFRNILLIVRMPLTERNSSNFYVSVCDSAHSVYPLISDLLGISIEVDNLIGLAGFFIFFTPYIAVGIANLCAIAWRLVKGSSGHKTHFHNLGYY